MGYRETFFESEEARFPNGQMVQICAPCRLTNIGDSAAIVTAFGMSLCSVHFDEVLEMGHLATYPLTGDDIIQGYWRAYKKKADGG